MGVKEISRFSRNPINKIINLTPKRTRCTQKQIYTVYTRNKKHSRKQEGIENDANDRTSEGECVCASAPMLWWWESEREHQ